MIIDIAMEELFNVSENYQADVVYMEKFFSCDEKLIPSKLRLSAYIHTDSFVEEPTFETEDISARLEKFLQAKFLWTPWSKFMLKDFLTNNEIKFPELRISEDFVHTFKSLFLSKKWLRVPTPLYVQRKNTSSMTRKDRLPESEINFWVNPIITGLDILDEFMRGIDFFKTNSAIRLQILNFFMVVQINNMRKALNKFEPAELYEIFQREFLKAGSTQPALISYLLVMNNLYRNELLNK